MINLWQLGLYLFLTLLYMGLLFCYLLFVFPVRVKYLRTFNKFSFITYSGSSFEVGRPRNPHFFLHFQNAAEFHEQDLQEKRIFIWWMACALPFCFLFFWGGFLFLFFFFHIKSKLKLFINADDVL